MGVWEAVALLALGASLVAWPLYLQLKVRDLQEELRNALNRIKVLRLALAGAEDFVELERTLDDARDLPPADELGLLLRDPPRSDAAEAAASGLGARLKQVEGPEGQGGGSDPAV